MLVAAHTACDAARTEAPTILNTKVRLRDATASLDVEQLGAALARNIAAVERAGGLRATKAALRKSVRRGVNAEHEAEVADLKQQLETMTEERNVLQPEAAPHLTAQTAGFSA